MPFCVFLYNRKLRCEDAQTAEMELIAAQYRGRARVLQAKLFVPMRNVKLFVHYIQNNCKKIVIILTW